MIKGVNVLASNDGMNYAPKGKLNLVVEPGEFNVGVTALDHGHISGMSNGLVKLVQQLNMFMIQIQKKLQLMLNNSQTFKLLIL